MSLEDIHDKCLHCKNFKGVVKSRGSGSDFKCFAPRENRTITLWSMRNDLWWCEATGPDQGRRVWFIPTETIGPWHQYVDP